MKDAKDVIIKLGKLALDGLLQEPSKQVFIKVQWNYCSLYSTQTPVSKTTVASTGHFRSDLFNLEMNLLMTCVFFLFQDEIIQNVGKEAFELGLLMGTESDPLEEEQTQVCCFQHIVFQEFTAGKFMTTLDKVSYE